MILSNQWSLDLFILGDTNINILNNDENMLDEYKDMRKRKSNFGAICKKYAQTCSTKTIS